MEKKILIVEDTIEILVNLKEFLQMEGFKIVTAGNGAEALLQLNNELPDLIITDLLMPQMTGYELIKELKKQEAWSKIPLLVFSARPLDETMSIKELGADLFLLKPTPPDVLLDFVIELLTKT
jgi:DNA-binding response OmpR family regulator